MFVIGLTGPISAGKTTVMGLFAELGAAVLAADDVARDLVKPGSQILSELRRAFGDEIVTPDGHLDRRRLGSLAFSSREALGRLNALVHPAMRAAIDQWLSTQRARPSPPQVAVIEAAVLAELGLVGSVDAVVYVDAGAETRIARTMSRYGLSRAEAADRVRAQEGLGRLRANARWVLSGERSMEALRGSCAKICEQIRTQ